MPNPRGETPPSLGELYADMLALGRILRASPDPGDPTKLRSKIADELQRVEANAQGAGYSETIDDARFAIVALLDEMLRKNDRWSERTTWLENPLQLEYYNTLRAGEEFFTRLDALRERPRENRPLLELYYQSLALGFEGKYFEYKDELAQLFAQLSKELAGDRDWTMDSVSPHWHPPPQQPAAPPRKPWRLRVAIGAVAVLLVFGAFHLWGQRKAQDASQNIRDTYQGMN